MMSARKIILQESRRNLQNAIVRHNRGYSATASLDRHRIDCQKNHFITKNIFGHWQPRLFQLEQVRFMGRKGGASAFSKVRPPTRKKLKSYHRRKRKLYHEKVGKHSKPGAKAGIRREYAAKEWQYLLDKAQGEIPDVTPEDVEYDFGNALLDDLIGNSSHLTSSPTPRPVNLGNKHKKQYSLVSQKMAAYLAYQNNSSPNADEKNKPVIVPSLPTDKEISMLLRSFRDKKSTKSRPLGIAKALELLVQTAKVPSSLFGENTYTTLMTCAASPKEARRVMKLMKDNSHPISAYSYSILVDVYSRGGDFRGADEVISEMRFENIEPTLAAYTSLLKGCYKAIIKGAIPQSIKAEAGVLAWDRWREMRITGIEADVMAYGAMIRIMAARGFPEKAINLIEEMQVFDVLPTTLIFTSALRAVSRSHANALRFQGGKSKKNKKRESIIAHHGKMAKSIVILAEQAQVEQDDGFISALMICAATAGDAATTKAIYLANQVRKMESLSRIGGSEHLEMLHGLGERNSNPTLHDGNTARFENQIDSFDGEIDTQEHAPSSEHSVNNVTVPNNKKMKGKAPTFQEREYGKDTRIISALLHANACAVESRGLGNVWAGRENKGYLCENSLRLINARMIPKYVDKSLPGLSSAEAGLSSLEWDDDEGNSMGKRLKRKKFKGVIKDYNESRIDDLSKEDYKLFVEGKDPYFGIDLNADEEDEYKAVENKGRDALDYDREDNEENQSSLKGSFEYIGDESEMTFTNESFENRSNDQLSLRGRSDDNLSADVIHEIETDKFQNGTVEFTDNESEMTFTNESFENGSNDLSDPNHLGLRVRNDDNLTAEVINKNDEAFEIDEDFDIDKVLKEFEDMQRHDGEENQDNLGLDFLKVASSLENSDGNADLDLILEEFEMQLDSLENGESSQFEDDDSTLEYSEDNALLSLPETDRLITSENDNATIEIDTSVENNVPTEEQPPYPKTFNQEESELSIPDNKDELDQFLDGFPTRRIGRIRKLFNSSLDAPSIIQLVPLVRENMPEEITHYWLKKKNLKDASAVMEQMQVEKSVDIHLMNSMLMVLTKAKRKDDALAYYNDGFSDKNIPRTAYTDRIVLQMLIETRDISGALQFKDEVESRGKPLDLLSYGSLIEYYGNHSQVGSAISTIKECISVHGSIPGEKALKKLRVVCRQEELEEELGLEELIGKDPTKWFREGESELKREYSKKGRRNILVTQNATMRI